MTPETYAMLEVAPREEFPKTVLVGDTGKLQQKTRATLVARAPKPQTFLWEKKPKSWEFPTPSPELVPHLPKSRRKG